MPTTSLSNWPSLFALSHSPVEEWQREALRPHCASIHVERLRAPEAWWGVLRAFLKGEPLQVGYWTTRRAMRHFQEYRQSLPCDAMYAQMVRTMKYLGGFQPGGCTTRVLDFQDALSLNARRRMERSRGLTRWMLRYECRALQRAEQKAQQLFHTTIIAPADRDAIDSSIAIVPNGVDTDFFHPSPSAADGESHTLVFTGNMAYAPNVDAACFLVGEVMPLVWASIPEATVLLAGADPKPAVKALAGRRVAVSGRLPDIRTAYASASLFVAPMRIGSGMQNKLLEAMAMHLPCVTTTLAAAPLGAEDGRHLLVGDNAGQLAERIVSLLGSDALRGSIADGGHSFVAERYSWQAAVAPLEEILTN